MKPAILTAVAVLCLALCGLAAEAALDKKISVDYVNLPMAGALKDLAEKTGVRIGFAADLVENLDNVNYTAKDQEAGRVLTRILRPRGLNIQQAGDGSVSVFKLDKFDEFKVKREEVYEFAAKPKVTREGDKVMIAFETKAFCDVTVAIEDANGKIIRHLASGVLGDNAPEPFQWNSKKQAVVWDGKNDQEAYVDDKDSHTVRVSLGLKPQFERTLYWSPTKRLMETPQPLVACPDGVLVYDGVAVDRILLFDHDGKYVRTVYPFPADKLDKVVGLEWETYPQDGKKLPKKLGFQQGTLITSGRSSISDYSTKHNGFPGVSAMATLGNRLILAQQFVNRLTTDGTTGGLTLKGGRTTLAIPGNRDRPPSTYHPYSAAVSPDQKWLYLACYGRRDGHYNYHCRGDVQRLSLEGNGEPEVFLGKSGETRPEAQFGAATSIDCDAQGNVYVADHVQNRVQVFSSTGQFLRSIPVNRPAVVRVHRKTNEIYCFSWFCYTPAGYNGLPAFAPKLYRFKPLPNPEPITTYDLPLPPWQPVHAYEGAPGYPVYTGEVDSWANELTVWVGRECMNTGLWGVRGGDGGRVESGMVNTLVFKERDGKLQQVHDLGQETVKAVFRADPTDFGYARLDVNPRTGKLYVKENRGAGKCIGELLEVDPNTGRIRGVKLPFAAEDICFDTEGMIYLRALHSPVVRYNFATWREVPWDYGEERPGLVSVLPIPGAVVVCFHEGGMYVNAKGRLVVSCGDYAVKRPMRWGKTIEMGAEDGRKYQPLLFPGRDRWQSLHIWDKHGKVIYQDVFPGTTIVDGVGLDAKDNLYVMAAPSRVVDGKPVVNLFTETIIKATPGKARVLSRSGGELPLPEGQQPRRPVDLTEKNAGRWVEGAEWMYGGVGFGGLNPGDATRCCCWHSRFCLDYLGRSFAPEIGHHSVAVLDTNGNLIVRVGQYGNVDDGRPLVLAGGPPNPRSIGGDELGLFYPQFVATHTDRRLFISDTGNGRIASVKLGYHAEEKVALKDVKDQAGK